GPTGVSLTGPTGASAASVIVLSFNQGSSNSFSRSARFNGMPIPVNGRTWNMSFYPPPTVGFITGGTFTFGVDGTIHTVGASNVTCNITQYATTTPPPNIPGNI